jgi:hypothetical protein
MFPKIMNDENFFKKAAAHGEEPPLTPQNEHQRSGLRFARRVRLPRAVGLAGMFLPIASTLVSHPPPGWWWLVLVGWAFVWPHLAWQIASRAVDPLSREIYNLKTDAVLAVMGSAKMVLETGEHPGALKDMVCSPGGTTIEAVRVLEEKGFRAAVIEAMTKCMEKSEKLSKS